MHYSKHTRTSWYSESALPSQGQALLRGKAYRIHVPCQMVYIGVTLGTIGSARYRAYLQFSEADDSNAWKKKGLETDGNRPTLQ